MTLSKAQIAVKVVSMAQNLETTLTDTSNALLMDLVDTAHYRMENDTNVSFDPDLTPERYVYALINLTAFFAVNYAADNDYNSGDTGKTNGRGVNFERQYEKSVSNIRAVITSVQ